MQRAPLVVLALALGCSPSGPADAPAGKSEAPAAAPASEPPSKPASEPASGDPAAAPASGGEAEAGGAEEAVAFTYTSLGKDACTWTEQQQEGGPPSATAECEGFGGYDLRLQGHDHGSELDLVRGGKPLGLRYEAPGWMADVTDGKIEWRHRGESPHALIFRVKWTDASSGDNVAKSTLVVARLDGATVCEIGRTADNEEARKLADDASKTCG